MTHQPDPDPSKSKRVVHRTDHSTSERADPADAPFVAERLTTLAHELNNLLDGTRRCVQLALRAVGEVDAADMDEDRLESLRSRLGTVGSSLERMADLVHTSMQGQNIALGSSNVAKGRGITLGEAIDHAMDVMSPLAQDHGTTMHIDLCNELGALHAGPLYTVILNAIRNAIESIHRAGEGGQVHVVGRLRPASGGGREVLIEIHDTGEGPPRGPRGKRIFEHGVSFKPRGTGVGLALSHQILKELRGGIELLPSPSNSNPGPGPGALLRFWFPAPQDESGSLPSDSSHTP